MKRNTTCLFILFFSFIMILPGILKAQTHHKGEMHYSWKQFVMGADLSFVNEIEDFGGIYKENNKKVDPFILFKKHGCNNIRVRLWHDPEWIRAVAGGKIYSDLADVEKTMRRAKDAGMSVNLDLHYSDDWADPNKQPTPDAWKDLSFEVLKDSVYQYTLSVLNYFKSRGLVPEMIQVGNETNFGMLWPLGKIVDDKNWERFGELLNSGIRAVRQFSLTSTIKPAIILHVAQMQFGPSWVEHITHLGKVTDFDIIGLSHYYKWSTVNVLSNVEDTIRLLRKRYGRKVMIVETAFPWTFENADHYNNLFGDPAELKGYNATKQGQLDYMIELTQRVISAGGSGIMYWEPAWITSPMKDRWGTGSAWENACLFDFNGNVLPGIHYMEHSYLNPKITTRRQAVNIQQN